MVLILNVVDLKCAIHFLLICMYVVCFTLNNKHFLFLISNSLFIFYSRPRLMTASGDDDVCPTYVPVHWVNCGVIVMLQSVPETNSLPWDAPVVQNMGSYCDVKINDGDNRPLSFFPFFLRWEKSRFFPFSLLWDSHFNANVNALI